MNPQDLFNRMVFGHKGLDISIPKVEKVPEVKPLPLQYKNMEDTVKDFMDGKEVIMLFGDTYRFHEVLGICKWALDGRTYVVNHGAFKTRNTFMDGQVIMEDI